MSRLLDFFHLEFSNHLLYIQEIGKSQDVAVKPRAFFASSEGASFHANSFLELNLSRPLLRACEALDYRKPTPIQVFITFILPTIFHC